MVSAKRARNVPVLQPFLETRFMENVAATKPIDLGIRFKLDQTNRALLFGSTAQRVVKDGWGPTSELLHVSFRWSSSTFDRFRCSRVILPRCDMDADDMKYRPDDFLHDRYRHGCVHQNHAQDTCVGWARVR